MSKSIKVSHKDIAEFWVNKVIKSNGEIIENADLSYLQNMRTVFPLNSPVPCCWACGLKTTKDISNATSLIDAYKYATDLNRCHIKARQFGGADEVSNLFLMCENCHIESPDTLNREAFFRWVYDRKRDYFDGYRVFGLMNDVKEELRRRGYSFEGINKAFDDLFTNKDYEHYISKIEKAYTDKVGLHGLGVSRSTSVIAVTDILLEFVFDKLLKSAFAEETEE